ncbi:MAG: nucleotidyltransferase family protein [Rhizobiales bacterium]|nr:nucleotidyltransferase family protein [Hyphomicrobiales bacterium]
MSKVGLSAMVLSAGLGHRMRPLTIATPKPLIKVAGKPIIDYGFDALRAAGIETVVVNVHYLADQVETWAQRQKPPPRILISDERHELLDTGGGVAKALPMLGDEPFFVLNSDSFWRESGEPALTRMRAAWDDATMDCLLLVCPLERCIGFDGHGDFTIVQGGALIRRRAGDDHPVVYIGCYLVHPRIFAATGGGAFSMNILWNKAIAAKRLYGLVHEGLWLHVGTPEAIPLAEAALRQSRS